MGRSDVTSVRGHHSRGATGEASGYESRLGSDEIARRFTDPEFGKPMG
jgi:hypothetical protein